MTKNGFHHTFHAVWSRLWAGLSAKKLFWILLGAAITSFGLYNIHRQVNITEGGVLGMMLFVNHWFGIPSSEITPVLDLVCYALAFRYLGARFIKISIVSTMGVSGFFFLWEQFPPLLPNLSELPLLAALLGGCFVGIGVGLIVRQGGSSGGDDALALAISKVTGWRLSKSYLATDLTVLAASLSYIPLRQIIFSVVTVTVSSWLIDLVQNASLPYKREKTAQQKE